MSQKFDFIAVGDITTDAFIKLKPENTEVVCDARGRKCRICVNFGDKIEYDFVKVVPAVGNSPNAAVSAHRLGLRSALATNLGDDDFGKEDMDALAREGVYTTFVEVHKNKPSNYHFVLWYEEERTILVKHHEYPYRLPDIGAPSWLYLSSLGETSLTFHHEIAGYVQKNPSVNLAFQPGTFQMKLGYEALRDIYAASKLFFCNKQEAARILSDQNEQDIEKLLERIHALGPAIAVITDGPAGAYTFDGKEKWHMPMYPDPAPPVDRTGAGDSFSSTFTAMLALGKTIPEALMRAPINSAYVVQKIGAQEGLLTLDALEGYLKEAPADYRPRQVG